MQHIFRGTGNLLTPPIDLRQGIVVLEARHAGSFNFIVNILPEGDGWKEPSINGIRDYHGIRAHQVMDGRPQTLGTGPHRLEIRADGDWEIKVTQPLWDGAPEPPVALRAGRGDVVIGPFFLDIGEVSVRLDYRGSKNFTAILMSDDGEKFEQVASATGAYSVSRGIRIQRNPSDGLVPGVYVLAIQADGEWSAEITD